MGNSPEENHLHKSRDGRAQGREGKASHKWKQIATKRTVCASCGMKWKNPLRATGEKEPASEPGPDDAGVGVLRYARARSAGQAGRWWWRWLEALLLLPAHAIALTSNGQNRRRSRTKPAQKKRYVRFLRTRRHTIQNHRGATWRNRSNHTKGCVDRKMFVQVRAKEQPHASLTERNGERSAAVKVRNDVRRQLDGAHPWHRLDINVSLLKAGTVAFFDVPQGFRRTRILRAARGGSKLTPAHTDTLKLLGIHHYRDVANV